MIKQAMVRKQQTGVIQDRPIRGQKTGNDQGRQKTFNNNVHTKGSREESKQKITLRNVTKEKTRPRNVCGSQSPLNSSGDEVQLVEVISAKVRGLWEM